MVNNRLYRSISRLYWLGNDLSDAVMKRALQPAIRLIAREQSTGKSVHIPLSRRLWLWRHGFLSRDDVLYDLDEESRHRYVSEYQRELTRPLNGRWKNTLNNKLHFHRLLELFTANQPTVYAYLKHDRFIPTDAPAGTARPIVNDVGAQVRDRLDRDRRLVLKPTYGTSGKRILVCSKTGDGYQVNGEEQTATEFGERIEDLDEYLVCEFIEQAPYAAELYPNSSNTLRILTMWDPKTDEPFVTFAGHRIGTDRSAPIDNFSRGGLSAEIDLDTGELNRGVHSPHTGNLNWHETHPETGAQIAGVEVPDWPVICDAILEIAENLPQLPYIGWDVIITDESEFMIIEANSCTDVTFQVHRPLLDDSRARRFYEHHTIISDDRRS